MLRLTGAVLVWVGCVAWGLRAAAERRSQQRLLEELVSSLEIMERELTLNQRALPELMRQLSARATTQSAQLFQSCADSMETGGSFVKAWDSSVAQLPLSREDSALLLSLGQVLGRYEDRGQGEAVSHIRRGLESRLALVRQQTLASARVYTALGTAAGGFLALILI
ncbi:MAG: stage III sporulation protein AB [Oscillospiraceae bacterium]|nr:stage III sporulation protein AB [Oscillospiraceae bacterium]